MGTSPGFYMDNPGTYRIRVYGRLSQDWVRTWCEKTDITVGKTGEDAWTEYIGNVIDQAALIGMINALYNFGFAIWSVERINSEVASPE